MQEFVIVEFVATKEVGVVSHKWIKDLTCFWPPYKSLAKLKKTLLYHQMPEPQWNAFNIRIISSYATYEQARRKLCKAEHTSDINTDSDDYGRGKRVRKQIHDSDDESEIETDLCTMSELQLPTPPCTEPIIPLGIPSMHSSREGVTNASHKSDSGLLKIILRELQIIKTRLQQQGEVIDSMSTILSSLKDHPTTEEIRTPTAFDLPLHTVEAVQLLENE